MTEQSLTVRKIDVSGERGLGRKLSNRMKSAFDASQLSLVGGRFAGEAIKARHLMPALTSMQVPMADPLREASFNAALPRAAETLVVGNADLRAESYIDAIGGIDFTNLPSVAVDLAKGDSGIVLRTVFGATEEMPFRALSYLLPALVLQDDLRKKGIEPPQLQIIFANHISGDLNNFSPVKVREQTDIFSLAARKYIARFFPELAEKVVFLEDEPQAVHGLKDVLNGFSDFVNTDFRQALVKKGFTNNLGSSLQYGAAHLLFHDVNSQDLLAPLFDQPEAVKPQTIISIGGLQEHFFYELRQSMKDYISDPVRTLQLFTRHHVPPYYLAQGGDVALAAIMKGEASPAEIARTASFDLEYLARESSKRGDFAAFIAELQSQRRRG